MWLPLLGSYDQRIPGILVGEYVRITLTKLVRLRTLNGLVILSGDAING